MFKIHKRSRLPHWQSTNAATFVTFNLFDAIPFEVTERFQLEKQIRLAELERLKQRATAAELAAIDQVIRERSEEHLDEGNGSCFMRDPRIAELVANAILFFDNQRYKLFAWCVMPNHVHAVLHCFDQIDSIVHSWKSFTSKEANRLLNREGKFWQDDYFDRLMRSRQELERTVKYVLDNPVKAGLENWPWVGGFVPQH